MSSLILAANPGPRALPDIATGITEETRAGMLAHSTAAVEACGPRPARSRRCRWRRR